MFIKIFFAVIIAVIISTVLKSSMKELLFLFQLSFGIILLIYILSEVGGTFSEFEDIINRLGIDNDIILVLIKGAFIAVITKISCDICRDSGNLLIEDIIELGGRIMIFAISLPYIVQIINTAVSFAD